MKFLTYTGFAGLVVDFVASNAVGKSSSAALLTGLGPEVIKSFSCSTQLSMKFVMLINLK